MISTSLQSPRPPVGELLRQWRERRRLSQLELSIQADISTRHLSFVETGRSKPSSEMIVRLTEQLNVPLRERNQVLLAGGYAPAYPETALSAPEMAAVREAVRRVLAGHEPYPALMVDRHWNLLDANAGIALFTEGCAPELLAPPVNVLRLGLHPGGMARHITNLAEWRGHLLDRLQRQAAATADPVLSELHEEVSAYQSPEHPAGSPAIGPSIVVPLHYRYGDRNLSFFSTTAVFGTPLDITLSELAIESFFPADPQTAAFLTAR
ncbi:helix-turn-helix transcriptional regulator [Rugosimonospora acidiphila]|uniref:Helix-turn-helix transcriptional regulator n=1 Tax=Rugosimonospora acidiphila TaxID=556531 RepID=A0ABP9RPR4_9ACTN